MKVVETNNLEKTYQLNNLAVHALRGISLSFSPGEFAAVAGPSGSGKTTFLHLVGCLDVPTAGTVSVSGNDTAVMTKKELAVLRRKTTGFIFQAYNLIPVLTAFENVSMPLVLLGIPSGEVRER
ncbi:MAG TPA: ATP-binding cassette domain-containing protein, partial [Treponemataceae bacterium]|nr:ATP-binding cassette domain-containing protein [Treponemataceae bacterium]